MSNLFSKHLHLCFFKLKYPTTTTLSPPHMKQTSPQSQSPSSPSPSSSSTDIFNSLYDVVTTSHSTSKSTDDLFSSSDDSEPWDPPPPPDFAAVFSSQRFFFSAPGLSNSIIESPDTRPCNSNKDSRALVPRGGVRVPKYSLNPYEDFRLSMQEMIESREVVDVRKDWDYLHELLLCYLALNPSHTHKYVVRAFTDLVVDLLASPSSPPPPTATTGGRVV
ncbi:hypothetical protein L6164_012742 [Bauhinia variegata]|uniref:Uncharacterized protein n=1 Tax=Bauhinia variegata TaxID=167791 RepID=A0ACB9PA06_BAUVA|nr:hypothetical protein L6164_012742 [Bauhinia variegata]